MTQYFAQPGSCLFKSQVAAKNLLIGRLPEEARNVDIGGISFSSLLIKVLDSIAPEWAYDGIVSIDSQTLFVLYAVLPGWSCQGAIPTVSECVYRLNVKDRAIYRSTHHKPLRECILTEPGFLDGLTLAAYCREDGWSLGIDTLAAIQFLCNLPSPSEHTDPCGICGEYYQDSEESPVQLPCGHVLGSNCLAQWMSPLAEHCHNTCPMCRSEAFDKPTRLREHRGANLAILTAVLPPGLDQRTASESDRLHAVWTRVQDQLRNIKYAFLEAARNNPHVTRTTRSDTRALQSEYTWKEYCNPASLVENEYVPMDEADNDCGEPMDLSD